MIPTPGDLRKIAGRNVTSCEKEKKRIQEINKEANMLERKLIALRIEHRHLELRIRATSELEKAAKNGKKSVMLKHWETDQTQELKTKDRFGRVKQTLEYADLPTAYQRICDDLRKAGYKILIKSSALKLGIAAEYTMWIIWN